MTAPEAQTDARIYDQGYRPFEGQLASPRTRFLVIALNELRLALKNKWFKRWILASFVPLIVAAVLVVIRSRFPMAFQAMWSDFWSSQVFFSLVIVYFVGKTAVGEDLATGALTVYFSRPVSFIQYLTGKWLAVAVGVTFVTLLPGLVLAIFRLLAEPHSGILDFAGWILWLLVLTVLLSLTMGWVMLAISSLTKRGRTAGVIWLALVVGLAVLAVGLREATNYSEFIAVSFSGSNHRLAEILFDGEGTFFEGLWAVAGQLIWIAVAFSVVLVRLRRWVRY